MADNKLESIEKLMPEVADTFRGFSARSSFHDGTFAEKFKEKINPIDALEKLSAALAEVRSLHEDAFTHFEGEVDTTHKALKDLGELKNGKWVKLDGKDQAVFDKAVADFSTAKGNVLRYLKGEKIGDHQLDIANSEPARKLKEVFTKFEGTLVRTKGKLNSWLGRLEIDGFKAAAKNSWGEVNFMDEATRKKIGFAKGAVAVGGAGAIVHAAFVSKNGDGEDRNPWVRLGEAVLGAGAIAGATLAGQAR